MKNYKFNLLSFYAAVVSLNFHLVSGKLVSLDLSVDSMFIDLFYF